jgi:hypothetical protein
MMATVLMVIRIDTEPHVLPNPLDTLAVPHDDGPQP